MIRSGVRLITTIAMSGGAGLIGVSPLGAQTVRLGVVMDGPRQMLETAWTEEVRQLERAYCVTDWSHAARHVSRVIPIQEDTIFRVFAVKPADARDAGPASVDFDCPAGVPEMHTHTPTTCMGDDVTTCVPGGLNAFSCQPSRGDFEKLISRGDQFAVIQCDKRAFRFYYPSEYAEPPTVASGRAVRPQVGNLTPAMKADEP
jgi:hypothetical protein